MEISPWIAFCMPALMAGNVFYFFIFLSRSLAFYMGELSCRYWPRWIGCGSIYISNGIFWSVLLGKTILDGFYSIYFYPTNSYISNRLVYLWDSETNYWQTTNLLMISPMIKVTTGLTRKLSITKLSPAFARKTAITLFW